MTAHDLWLNQVLALMMVVKMKREAPSGLEDAVLVTPPTPPFNCVDWAKTYLELIKLQCLRDDDQFLHLSHLSNLRVALVNDLFG